MTTRTRRRIHTRRPPMTAEEARAIPTFSAANAALIVMSLHCNCQPYQDVYTLARWNAQGYHVRKGEHGIRIPVITATTTEDDATGETHERRLFTAAHVFCRCQVERRNES